MRFIDYLKSLSKKNNYTEWEWNRGFSISVGEICEVCFDDLDIHDGGYRGEPTKCDACDKQIQREGKLNDIGI